MTIPPSDGPPPDGTGGEGGTLAGRLLARRYRLVRPLASGGMATVWEAQDEILTRPVAVKVLHAHLAADAAFVTRFRAEAISAAHLTHPSIVSIYDTLTEDGLEAIVMELVRGTTLRHLLDHRGPLDPTETVTIANHIAAALEAAHRGGIIHRDIKPANVLLSSDGRVLVTDFGIAKATEGADLTTERTMLGTAKYLAPEQVEGAAVDARADLYALGIVLYEMLCGHAPFSGETDAAIALARLHRLPDPPSTHRQGLSPSLQAVVLRCLARKPAERFADAATLRAALTAADTALGPPSTPSLAVTDHLPIRAGAAALPAERAPAVPVRNADERLRHEAPPTEARSRRSARLILAALVATAVLVGAVLAVRVATRTPAVDGPPQPVAIAGAEAFDPLGIPPGEEHNDEAVLAVDDDIGTAWTTETYRRFGKAGVGLVVQLVDRSTVGSVAVRSPSTGWSGSIYTVDAGPGADLASWGRPAAVRSGLDAGSIRFRFAPRSASAVLLWVTALGEERRFVLTEVTVTDR